MVRKKKIQVPTRAEGDPTGQTRMLQEQVDAVYPGQEIERPTPAPSKDANARSLSVASAALARSLASPAPAGI